MKVLRCSDDAYARIAEHAGERRISLSAAVGELVDQRVTSPEYAEDMALPLESVREVIREELQRRGGEVSMSECVSCQLKDRDLADLDKEIVELNTQLTGEKQAHPFRSFQEALAHAKSGNCPSCKTSLEDMAEGVARTTLTEIDDKALLELAISRGVLPDTIEIELRD